MNEIMTLIQCLEQCLPVTSRRQLGCIIPALLVMTGRVTMLSISRWTDKGGSYRTIQRFFHSVIPWARVLWLFFRHQLYEPGHEYILAGDESVVTKSGKHTYGLDRFFASLYGKPVPGLAFFALSLVDVQAGTSSPIMVEQIVRTEAEKAAAKARKKKEKSDKRTGKQGWPKGSKNKAKTHVEWTPELRRIDDMFRRLLSLIDSLIPLKYVVMDGHFGNHSALQLVRSLGSLHLISKLRHDSALYFQYEGPQKQFGPRKRYGDKIDYQNLPDQYLVHSHVEQSIRTHIYQAPMLHKSFAGALNIVIIVKQNLQTGKQAHVILFSSDPDLPADKLIRYYSLRFQIEFNFRDAKQFWGMEDFMNVAETAVLNAVSLSLFMVNVSQRLLRDFRQDRPDAGVLDLKAYFRGRKYAQETIKLLPQKPQPILFSAILDHIGRMGCIHSTHSALASP
ncbi:MAG: transposase [Caldilineales bacterium]|nr:transposase [Caldilineales bacterium]